MINIHIKVIDSNNSKKTSGFTYLSEKFQTTQKDFSFYLLIR